MINKIKKQKILENSEKRQEFEKEIEYLEKKIINLTAEIELKKSEDSKKKNLFSKIFKNTRRNSSDILEELYIKLTKEKEKLENVNVALRKIYSIINRIENASNFEMLGFSSEEELFNYCVNNNVEITDEEKLFNFPNLTRNDPEFMKNMIKKDLSYIIYDETMDIDLYCCFINILIEQNKKFIEQNKKHVLANYYKLVIEDMEKFVFKLKDASFISDLNNNKFIIHMFKNIQSLALSYKSGNREYDEFFNVNFNYYFDLYNSGFAKELEKLYEMKDIIIGVHGTYEDIYTVIFKEGLCNSRQSNAIMDIDRTVGYDMSFLQILELVSNKNTNNLIVTIPKTTFDLENPTPIWGSNELNSEKNYILPQYIYGVIDKNNLFIKNNAINMNEYRYLYCNKQLIPVEGVINTVYKK